VTRLSVVVPVYGCAPCLKTLHERVSKTLSGSVPDHELIFVDDASRDGAWPVLEALAAADPKVRGVKLSRNFGQHAAITAGLAESKGERVVVLDCDLQDPPEEIPRLLAKAAEGFDVVYARRLGKKHSLFRRAASALYFWLVRKLNKHALSEDFGSFSVISRRVVDAYLGFHDHDRHYLMIVGWLGFPSAVIDYEHRPRRGSSSYTIPGLIRHAFDGLFFQTTALLRWIVYFGLLVSFAGLALAAYIFGNYFFRSVQPGWTSLSVLILLMGGVSIISTGVAGLYLGKVFDQVRQRPLYVVEKKTAARA
jgi:polyisoprenyl-phosphate glycosyltransferase